MPEISDREILASFKNENTKEAAFSQLVKKYQERLYWHCRKIVINHDDTDDVLQNTFVKIWKNLDSFKGNSSVYTWMFRVATNEALTLLKSNKKIAAQSGDSEYENYIAENLKADAYFEGSEIELKLHKAILLLPEKQRMVFNMKYFDEMKYDDISKILNTSVGALKASYHHAVKKIENYLKEE